MEEVALAQAGGVLPSFDMELVRPIGSRRRGRTERAGWQEETKARVVLLDGIGSVVFVKESSSGEDKVRLPIRPGISSLPFEHARM